jgi:Zn-dependent peptidase ImmA (M78 family)
MARSSLEHAAAKAEAWLRDNGFTSLPIDLVKVAELLEIPVCPLEQTKPGVSGMLHRDGDQFVIMYGTYVNNAGFQRFSIAHEIGHYLLPGHPEHLFPAGVTSHSSQAGFTSANHYEQEADYFASGLLMPDSLVKSALRRLGEGLEGIEALRDKCLTSMTATAITYARKTSVPAAIVISTKGYIDCAFLSESMKEFDGLSWPKKGEQLPAGTVSAILAASASDVREGKRAGADIDLRTWLAGKCTITATEEAVGLGSYGKVLTVLTTEISPEDLEEDDELANSWRAKFRR